mgnify:CR=1 FL=1
MNDFLLDYQIVLVDVDGVLADFRTKVRNDFYKKNDILIQEEQTTVLFDDEVPEEFRNSVQDLYGYKGFHDDLKPTKYAKDILDIIRVCRFKPIVCTSPPLKAREWIGERVQWLQDNFKLSLDQIIFTRNKQLVAGKTLIDDLPDNLSRWHTNNNSPGICWNPNRVKIEGQGFIQVTDTDQLYSALRLIGRSYV